MPEQNEELIQKYVLAGKIRFISFSLLLLFLWSMKSIGGYSYLNGFFIALIFVEAVLNQPYPFIIRRVNVDRFQYFQMAVDIIAISWIMHYMGGIEAPLVSVAYYAVILWAGVVSSVPAVVFAVTLSAVLFSAIVISEHIGLLPLVSYFDYKMPSSQMISLVAGNVAFLFAFGYFSARTSNAIKTIERKRQEDTLKYTHKLFATGHLVGNAAHDILNSLASIRGYTEILMAKIGKDSVEGGILKDLERLEKESINSLDRLARFSHKPKERFEKVNINEIIKDAVKLTWPLVRYSKMAIKKEFYQNMPLMTADEAMMEEVFVALILNALEATGEGSLTIKTDYLADEKTVKIIFSDTGSGISEKYLSKIADPFFTTKGTGKALGLGLTIAYEIVERHCGVINVESKEGKGAAFTIQLPL